MATYTGTSGNDTYTGNGEDDSISGLGGNDILSGGGGNDTIDGGDGDDKLSGGDGNDQIYSYSGTDKLLDGGAGDDTIHLANATITAGVLVGGAGSDTLALDGAVIFNMAKWNAKDAGFENFYSYNGFTITGTGDANRFDFSDLIVTSRYGVYADGLAGDDVLVGTSANDSLSGGDDNDTLTGNAGADGLYGENGDDTLLGGDGTDTLSGGVGTDTLSGGNDNDSLGGGTGNDTLVGGSGDDTLDGAEDADTVSGGDGNDQIYAYSGTDLKLDGGTGDDTVHIANVTINAGVLIGFTGIDTLSLDGAVTLGTTTFDPFAAGFENFYSYNGFTITGTSGADRYDFSRVTATSRYGAYLNGLAGNDQLIGTSTNDSLSGGDDNDTLTGNAGADGLYGENGDDTLLGGDGTDTLSGGVGTDTLNGGNDNDSLGGGTGNDTLVGGSGDDTLDGAEDADTVSGGDGNDQIYAYSGTELKLDGGTGDDTVHIANVTLNAGVLIGGSGIDTLSLDGAVTLGTTVFDPFAAGFENFYSYNGFTITGTSGADRYDFSRVTATSRYGAYLNGLAGNDQLIGTSTNDSLSGGDDNDSLTGNAGADGLYGENGDDTLSGGDGTDSLYGGVGTDSLNGGNDNDSLNGGTGNDTLVGGSGDDTLDGAEDADTVSGGDGNDQIYAYSGTDLKLDGGTGDDTVHIANVTLNAGVLVGGTGIDTLSLDGAVTLGTTVFDPFAAGFETFYSYNGFTITGTSGADRYDFSRVTATSRYGAYLSGLAGNDQLIGTSTNDSLSGGDDNDTLTGNAGADGLYGENGDDTLLGGDGTDTLSGGVGTDQLDGGSENDSLAGDVGDDALVGGSGDDTLDGGADNDAMSGGSGNDTIYLFSGVDTLADGGDDDDHIVLGTVTFRDGEVFGGKGIDLFDLSGAATFAGQRFAAAEAGFENFYNYNGFTITGTSGANTLDFSGLTSVSRYGVILDGADGDDVLVGLGAADTLIGGAGDDVLEGGNGDDGLTGGDGGIDLASYAGASAKVTVTLLGQGAAQDTLGAGRDTLTGFEGLIGSLFADTLIGDAGVNRLFGNAGADRLEGGDGADILSGGAGSDLLIGGAARDIAAYGARWVDFDVTASGANYFVADRRPDVPEGSDTLQTIEQIRYTNGTFAIGDTINVGPTANADAAAVQEKGAAVAGSATASGSVLANDTDPNLQTIGLGETLAVVSAAANGGAVVSVAGATTLEGVYGTLALAADGSWTYQLDDTRVATQDLRDGETVTETFAYTVADAHGLTSNSALTVTVMGASDTLARADLLQVTIGQASALDLAVLTGDDAFAPGTTLTGITNAAGASVDIVDGKLVIVAAGATASFDYTLTAANGETSTAHVDVAGVTYGQRAVLTADPAASAVDFVGGDSLDELTGGAGMDRLVGNAGADKLTGGAGDDALYGGDAKDVLAGGAGDDLLDGGAGPDTASYVAATGAVTVDLNLTETQDTGDGRDTLVSIENLSGGRYDDALTGTDGNNTLRGNLGNDTLVGNAGNDVLIGGIGADTLAGGRGADIFRYEALGDFGSLARPDKITDFSHAGGDRIDLSLIDPDTATGGDQAFTFIGSAAFTPGATAFELRFEATGDGTFVVQADLNHDGVADYSLRVASPAPLVAEDFVL